MAIQHCVQCSISTVSGTVDATENGLEQMLLYRFMLYMLALWCTDYRFAPNYLYQLANTYKTTPHDVKVLTG